MNSEYLSAAELADLVGCKANQRSQMIAWLDKNRWKYVVDAKGMPKVARAHRDRKMGVIEQEYKGKYDETPNLNAFA